MPKRRRYVTSPSAYHLKYERVAFRSSDGTILVGWYMPAAAVRPSTAYGAVVLCHGVDSNRADMLAPARILNEDGFNTLVFDFRARGESGGDRCTLGFREQGDLEAAVDYVAARPDCRDLAIGVLGDSMGSAVSLMTAAHDPRIKAIVAESPFASLDHAIANNFSNVLGPLGWILAVPTTAIGERLIGAAPSDVSPIKEIHKISPRPILLIHDEEDKLCPPSETRDLMAAAGPPKTLWSVPGAVHIGAIVADPKQYRSRICGFFENALIHAQTGR